MIGPTQDPPGLLDHIIRSHRVGRVREMAEAKALWQHVAQGESQVLWVAGEPGVGKTRFVRELASVVRLEGAGVLMGACYAEGSAPYTPLTQILRDVLEFSPQTVIDLPDETLLNLIPIIPSIGAHLSGRSLDLKTTSHAGRQQIVEGFAAFCSTLCSHNPLLLFVDDVHWADPDTLFLLRGLARRARQLPVLIVLTYREAEAHPLLKEIQVDLNHERLSLQLHLDRFTLQETSDLLATMFDQSLPSDFLEGIYRQTEGNPFFIEEVCKALVEAGLLSYQQGHWHYPARSEIKIPQTVRAAIQLRLQKLPQGVQDVLRMAAILGGDFEFDALRQACDLDEDSLIGALETALRAQLIAEIQMGQAGRIRFSFVHGLIPTTLREGIIHVRRRKLHLRAAQAVESVRPEDFEALGYHYTEAGEPEPARRYFVQAGDRAQRAAPSEAARYYQAALASWPETDEAGRAEALAGLGYCLWTTDHVQEALQVYETASGLFQKLDNRTRSGEMQWMLGQIYWEQTDRETSMRHYRRALAILEQGPETPELARAISEISRMHLMAAEYDQALTWGRRALEMAQRLGAKDVEAHALVNMGTSLGCQGNFDQGLSMLETALQNALASGLPPVACRAYDNWADVLVSCCRYPQGLEVAEQLMTYAVNVHGRNFVLKGILRLMELNWYMGRWGAALSERAQLFKSSSHVMDLFISLPSGKIDIELGMPEKAARELEATLPSAIQAHQPEIMIIHLGERAQAYALLGEQARAAEVLHQMIDFVRSMSHVFLGEFMPLCFAVQWFAAQDLVGSKEIVNFCLEKLEGLDAQFHTGESQAALAEARGSWLRANQRLPEAKKQFQQAAEHWQAISRPYDQARLLVMLGEVLEELGDSQGAKAAYSQAAQLFDSLTGQLDSERQATFLASPPVQGAHRGCVSLTQPKQSQKGQPETGPLTVREVEVLKLVSQGLTNAQIAEHLFLSPLTVNAHLRSIFNKLDVTTRTAAAHQALELGLL